MLSVEAWTTVRYLHAQGKPIRTIARELGLARNTVRAALKAETQPRYRRPPRPNPQLTPFHDTIRRMALEQRFIGTRILRELTAQGYTGGKTALYAYLHTLKRSQPDPRVTMRFETAPGEQAQFDWSPYTVTLAGQETSIVAFGLTLGYSRRKHHWVSGDETQSSVFEALEAGFAHFGGVPKELLVDNAKVFVLHAQPERFAWNPHFLALCGHYRLEPIACAPYWPRTKGKVERPFFYLEEQFIKGGSWSSFDALTADLAQFVAEDLDLQVHSTTQERPVDRFRAELPQLTPLPATAFVGSHEESRTVSWDCLVAFAGSRYSVPWAYAGQPVWVRGSQGVRLLVRNQQGEQIAQHALATVKGSTVIDPAHYEGLMPRLPKTRALATAAFRTRFPEHDWFLEGLYAQHLPNGTAHLRAILGLAELYPAEALRRAFAAARQYQSFSHAFVRGLLEADGQMAPSSVPSGPAPPLRTRSVTADLGVYQALLEGRR
jgi:transposase